MQHNSHELDQSLVVNSFVSSEPRSFRVFVFIFRRSRRCVIAYNFYRSATIIYHIFISIFNSVFCWSSSFPFQSKNATTVKKPETHEIQFLRFKINIIHSFTSTQTHIRHKIMDTFFDFSCFVLLCFCFSYDHDWNRSEYSRVIAIWSNITSTSFVLSVPNPDDDDFFFWFCLAKFLRQRFSRSFVLTERKTKYSHDYFTCIYYSIIKIRTESLWKVSVWIRLRILWQVWYTQGRKRDANSFTQTVQKMWHSKQAK